MALNNSSAWQSGSQYTQDFGTSVAGVMGSLADASGKMRSPAEAMAAAAGSVRIEAHATSEGAAKSSQDLTAVATAVEELTSSVGEITRQVAAAADMARQAVRRAEASHGTMESLSEATVRIGGTVHLISKESMTFCGVPGTSGTAGANLAG